jgi:hypothetical protein
MTCDDVDRVVLVTAPISRFLPQTETAGIKTEMICLGTEIATGQPADRSAVGWVRNQHAQWVPAYCHCQNSAPRRKLGQGGTPYLVNF